MVNGILIATMTLAAIDIDVGRQLFVDDFLVESTQGIVRVYNHPVKEFDRPLIVPETELERSDKAYGHRVAPTATVNSGGLWWDPSRRVFRLWYGGIWISHLLYAESTDGINFERPDRTAAIASSRWGSGKWDTGYVSAVGGICVIRDERLWFYYAATRGDATAAFPDGRPKGFHWRDGGLHFNSSIGVASLRRDGFAGMVADGKGMLITKPILFSGRHLFVNAECRFGSLSAEVVDADGRILPEFSADECVVLRLRDATKAELKWRHGDLACLSGKPVRLRFLLHCGTLYSFWVSADPSGKSSGYLAAGGPDYPGLRDL